MRALISVSDKTGILELALALHKLGIDLISTGGTAQLLMANGLPVTEVAQLTGLPEMLDGRLKTLHPHIHGGLLAQRNNPEHTASLLALGISPIDILVVNLYPFEATIAQDTCTLAQAIEQIDIGGPAMVRSAAKNWQHVAVLTQPSQYPALITELQQSGHLSDQTRFALSVAAFNRISAYDAAISNYLGSIAFDPAQDVPLRSQFPVQNNLGLIKWQDLRYGENPHQSAAVYRDPQPAPGSIVTAEQIQGKALSYNNIADADTAWECVKNFSAPACVIVKHANPCGAAIGTDAHQAYKKALQTDPTSAFGGVIAINRPLDGICAQAIAQQFVEVIIAPGYSPEARHIFKAKSNVRLLDIALPPPYAPSAHPPLSHDLKRINSGLLIQTADQRSVRPDELKIVTHQQPSEQQRQDLLFAYTVAKYVKSNAIVFCKNGMTLGIGAGQMSRLDSARIATIKAAYAQLPLQGSAVASDAFFPFRDGLDVVADAGASCIIQPGGSLRDQEVINAANERALVMVCTGLRHFRH